MKLNFIRALKGLSCQSELHGGLFAENIEIVNIWWSISLVALRLRGKITRCDGENWDAVLGTYAKWHLINYISWETALNVHVCKLADTGCHFSSNTEKTTPAVKIRRQESVSFNIASTPEQIYFLMFYIVR